MIRIAYLAATVGFLVVNVVGARAEQILTSFYPQKPGIAASLEWPQNTLLQVRYLKTGKTRIVRIGDTGPFCCHRTGTRGHYHYDRGLDISEADAKALGFYKAGLAWLEVKEIH